MISSVLMPLGGDELTSGYKGYGLGAAVELLTGMCAGKNTIIIPSSPIYLTEHFQILCNNHNENFFSYVYLSHLFSALPNRSLAENVLDIKVSPLLHAFVCYG